MLVTEYQVATKGHEFEVQMTTWKETSELYSTPGKAGGAGYCSG